jgi:hypothetical protein
VNTTQMKAAAAAWIAAALASIGFAATAHARSAANLPVSDDIRDQLVVAGADLVHRPPAEFSGLIPGKTFYAYDPATETHWAAAKLRPASQDAGIALQDQNSYVLFEQSAGGRWNPFADGYALNPCPAPVSVRDVWGWPAGVCAPGTAHGA